MAGCEVLNLSNQRQILQAALGSATSFPGLVLFFGPCYLCDTLPRPQVNKSRPHQIPRVISLSPSKQTPARIGANAHPKNSSPVLMPSIAFNNQASIMNLKRIKLHNLSMQVALVT